MTALTHEQGARILARHHVEARASAQPDHIEARAESVTRDGRTVFEWETVPLRIGALRDWLGY